MLSKRLIFFPNNSSYACVEAAETTGSPFSIPSPRLAQMELDKKDEQESSSADKT